MTGRKQSMGSMERLSPTERGNYLASQCLLRREYFETGVGELGGEKGKAKGHLSLQGEDKAGALFLMRAAAGSTVKKEGGVGGTENAAEMSSEAQSVRFELVNRTVL